MSEPVLGANQMQTLVSSKKYEGITGVPLSIVGSGDNPDTGVNEVVLEDPEGVTFSVPRKWIVGHDIEHAQDEFLDHKKISAAPPGELERIWQEATNNQTPVGSQVGAGGFFGGNVPTVLDAWKGWHDADGNEVARGGVPTSLEDPLDKTSIPSWHPSVAKSRLKLSNTQKVIPPDAGAGWGNPGQVWNPRTQLWENR